MNLNRFVTNVQEIILNIARSAGIEEAAITPELNSRLRAVIRSTALYANRVGVDTATYRSEFLDAIIPRLRNTGIRQGINIPDSVLSNIRNSISQTFSASVLNEIIMDMDDTSEYEAFLDNDYQNIVNELENIEENRQALEAAQDVDPDNTPSQVDEVNPANNNPETIENYINRTLDANQETTPRALKKGQVQKAIYDYVGNDYNQADIDLFQFLDNIDISDSQLTGNINSSVTLYFTGGSITKNAEGVALLDNVINNIETILSDVEGVDVVEIEYQQVESVSTTQKDLARQYTQSSESPNLAVGYKYINMGIDEVQDMLGNILYQETMALSSKYNVNVTNLYPGGPLITAAREGHKHFEQDILNRITRSNELQSILDNSKLKWVTIGGNKPSGGFKDMNIYKGGVKKYFQKLLRGANPETKASWQKLSNKPGYVIGLEFTDPSGRKHIVSGMVTDGEYTNTIGFSRGSNVSTIQTNFFNYDPNYYADKLKYKGYFPNILNGKAKSLKGRALFNVTEWFQGMLAVADVEDMILDQSPINSYVGNFYQKGDFIWDENAYLLNATSLENAGDGSFSDSMIRYPNKDRALVDDWKAPIAKGEWTIGISKETLLFSRPRNIQVTKATKNFYTAENIDKSPRHNAIKYLMNKTNNDFNRPINQKILELAGIKFGSTNKNELFDYIENQTDTKYIFKQADIDIILLEIYKIDPKILGQIVVSSEQLKQITGVDLETASDEIKQVFNFTETLPIDVMFGTQNVGDTVGGQSGKSVYKFLELIADNAGPGVAENNLKLYIRDGVQGEFSADVQDVTEEYRKWIYDVNETAGQTTEAPTPPTEAPTLQTTDTTTRGDTPRTIDDVLNTDFYSNNDFSTWRNAAEDVYENLDYNTFQNNFTGMHIADNDYVDWDIFTRGVGESDLSDDTFSAREIAEANRWGDNTPINTNVNGIYYLDDTFRHNFLRNIQYTISEQLSGNTKILAADVEYVGPKGLGADVHDYFEIGVVYETTDADGVTKQYRVYETVRTRANLGEVKFFDTIRTGTPNINTIHILSDALAMTLTEQGYNVNNASLDDTSLNGRGRLLVRTHPSSRIGRVMGIAMPYPGESMNFINNYQGNTTYTPLTDIDLSEIHRENLEKRNNQTRTTAANVTESQIQTFYSQHELDYRVNFDGSNPELINKNLEELFNFIDNKTTGAVQITFNNGVDAFVLTKHTNQPLQVMEHADSSGAYPYFLDDIQYLKNNLQFPEGSEVILPQGILHRINKVTFLVPNEDIVHNVLPSFIKRLNDEGTAIISDGSNVNLFYQGNMNHEQPQLAQYRVTSPAPDEGLEIFGDPDSPDNQNVRANYGYGQSMNVYDDRIPLYQSFNETRVPVGNNPSTSKLREMARAFAQTKTGKGLGYAWKTIDIGETLISKAFAQAQKAALAAGAVGLGGAAATAATVWAFYEITNLVFSALQGIPELYNVNRKRNDILVNGEQWEKDFVEDTFWQDYGPELLEILQEAGDRSPAEMLSDKIWTFTLDNLMKQSQGEVIPEALVDDSEELDMRDDLWYANVPNDYKIELMQDNIDYDKVLSGYYNNRPEANVIMNRTLQLANDVYNRDR
jgi:hypothetical protein